jgi:hypothetical protein
MGYSVTILGRCGMAWGDEFSKLVHKTIDMHTSLCYTGVAETGSSTLAALIAAVVIWRRPI